MKNIFLNKKFLYCIFLFINFSNIYTRLALQIGIKLIWQSYGQQRFLNTKFKNCFITENTYDDFFQ